MKLSKPIIVDSAHADKINAALAEVQGKAKVRTVDAEMVIKECAEIEKRLGVSKVALEGTSAWVNPHGGRFPKAYKYIPYGTKFRVEYRQTHKWYLTEIFRENCGEGHHLGHIYASESAKSELISRILTI